MLIDDLKAKCAEAKCLRERCLALQARGLNGSEKLLRKIEKEESFLSKLLENPSRLKSCHLACTNLKHCAALLDGVERHANVKAILQPFHFSRSVDGKALLVDIVADDGLAWIKTVARNAKGLHRIWEGDSSQPERSIVDQAKLYVKAPAENLVFYRPPKVVFDFAAGVTEPIAAELRKLGVEVKGDVVSLAELFGSRAELSDNEEGDEYGSSDGEESSCSSVRDSESETEASCGSLQLAGRTCVEQQPVDPKHIPINLDITALFAFVSNLTNGHADCEFDEVLLNEQAKLEKENPALPFLHSVTEGRKIYVCQTAYDSFLSILRTVGGPTEKTRADVLLRRLDVMPDCMSDKVERLKLGGKIKLRSKIIFGAGDERKFITLTANRGFLMAAENQGVRLAAILHESRALSEQKEKRNHSGTNDSHLA